MIKRIVLLTVLGISLLLSGCSVISIGAIRGSGNVITEGRTVEGFDKIALDGYGDVEVIVGDTELLTIEAEDNLLEYIETRVIGSRLVISTRNNANLVSTRPIRYTVMVKSLSELAIGGSGDVVAKDFIADRLKLEISGSGNILVSGLTAAAVDVKISGSGTIEAEGVTQSVSALISGSGNFVGADLQSNSADVTISGSGDITVWAVDQLDANISGSGSIMYYGSPDVNQSMTGSGKITGRGQ